VPAAADPACAFLRSARAAGGDDHARRSASPSLPGIDRRRWQTARVEHSSWSVRLAVEEADAGPISREMSVAWTRDVHLLVIGAAGSDEPVTITSELDAVNPQAARILAQHLLGKVRSAAGLKVHESSVVWVAPLLGGAESSHRFLSHATDLIDEEAFDLAVVAVQIHLEVQVATLVRRAVAASPSPLVQALVVRERGWPPHDRWARPVLEALFDVRMTTFPRGRNTPRMSRVATT
jgi:hypothetical protein